MFASFDRSDRRLARWRCTVVLAAALGGCGDGAVSRDSEPGELRADALLIADHGERTASVRGQVDFAEFSDPEGVRLVDGDHLAVGWDGAEYRLRRRGAPYVYERRFALPPGREPELIFRLVSSGRDAVTRRVATRLPDVTSFELLERERSVASDTSLTLSWNLDPGAVPVRDQVLESLLVELSPVACTNADGAASTPPADARMRRPLPEEATTATLPLADVFAPVRALGAARCRYAVRLEATVEVAGDAFGAQAIALRSVTISAPANVEVVDANAAEATR